MKKQTLVLLLMFTMLLPFSGCGKEETTAEQPTQEIQTEIHLEECGLAYTIPEAWATMENCNLIPSTSIDPNSEIYAKILYQYTPDENMDALNDITSDIPIEELMTPIVELLVVKEEYLDTEAVDTEFARFRKMEVLPAKKEFNFYLLTDYADGIDHFSKDAQAVYRKLEESLPALKESIETFVPDEESVIAAIEENSKYLNFITNTLEGDPITSAVFYDYDMTVVNFWASYCYPDINELDTLQTFYQNLQKKHPNVNFLQVVIDTPGEEAEETIAKAYKEAGADFTAIMPDQNLAKWIMENLNGLPTTIFVDSTGKPLDLKIEGIQDAAYYMETTESMLETINTAE